MAGLLDMLNQRKQEEQNNKEIANTKKVLKVSQSLLKLFYNQHQELLPHCPLEIYESYFNPEKKYKIESDAMTKGKFGEGLLLGKSAKGDLVTGLERHKKTGEPVIDELRIRQMAHLAKIKLNEYMVPVYPGINTQVPVAAYLMRTPEQDVILQTELDLFPTNIVVDNKSYISCIDIKWPSNPHSTFGAFSWANPQFMDHIQPDSIFWILEHIDLDLCKQLNPEYEEAVGYDNIFTDTVKKYCKNGLSFFYFVIGYNKVEMNNILPPIRRHKHEVDENGRPMNNHRQMEVYERMRKGVELINTYFDKGFLPMPYEDKYNFRGCTKCPVNKKNGGHCVQAQEIINC